MPDADLGFKLEVSAVNLVNVDSRACGYSQLDYAPAFVMVGLQLLNELVTRSRALNALSSFWRHPSVPGRIVAGNGDACHTVVQVLCRIAGKGGLAPTNGVRR